MLKFFCFILFYFLLVFNISAQSIRKNFREMTESEKIDLVNAFYQLRQGEDLINDLAEFHRDFFNFDGTSDPERLDIHINLPDEPEREIFFAWHRRQMMELEHAMQEINPNISIPFVDWGIDNSSNSPLWDENFMGQFNDDWSLNRSLGAISQLPTTEVINNAQDFSSDFFTYSNNVERGNVHSGPHLWIRGEMSGRASPRDPVFYLHHTFLDKLWNEWQNTNGNSGFLRTDMLRYDGNYIFDGRTLPLVNPNDILQSNILGVFYAENQLAILQDYEVSNNFRDSESFYYQFSIEMGNNFKVPANKNCKVESVNEINLKPGFYAEMGSSFVARIDENPVLKSSDISKTIVRNQIPFEPLKTHELNAYEDLSEQVELDVNFFCYPNPFSDKINIQNKGDIQSFQVFIFDLLGNELFSDKYYHVDSVEISNLNKLNNGMYFLIIKDKDRVILNSKLIKQ